MNDTPAFSLSDAWPVIEADDLVKCECGHIGKPEMTSETTEPHGEVTIEPRCEACLSSWVSVWPRD